MSSLQGMDIVLKNLNTQIKKIKGVSKAGLKVAGMFIEKESMKQCPVVTSNLKNSHYTELFDTLNGSVVEIGYTAFYAPFVHENPRAGKTKGVSSKGVIYRAPMNPSGKRSTMGAYSEVGKWKFLEDPIKTNTKRILSIIKKRAKLK